MERGMEIPLRVQFCVFCEGKRRLKTSAGGKLYCLSCRKNQNPTRPTSFDVPEIDATPEHIQKIYGPFMKYCYNCGEKVTKEEGNVMCLDGCELVDFQLGDFREPYNVSQNDGITLEETYTDCTDENGTKSLDTSSENIYDKPPDDSKLQELSERIKMKWKWLGEELKVPEDDLEPLSAEGIPPEECYSHVIQIWKDKETVPYTWDVFLQALSSIKEDEIKQELSESLLGIHNVKRTISNCKFVSDLFLLSGNNWTPPEIHINDCKESVTFYVVIDLSDWGLNPEKEFQLSLSSLEMNKGWEYYGDFDCCFEKENLRLYCCTLPLPDEFLCEQNKYFRYKYVIRKIKRRFGSPPLLAPRYEVLSMYKGAAENSYRYLKIGKSSLQFDSQIKPKESLGWVWYPDPVQMATSALSLYIDWAANQKWIYIDASDAEKRIKATSQKLAFIFESLRKHPCYLVNREVIQWTDKELSASISIYYEALMTKLGFILSEMALNTSFLSGLLFTYIVSHFIKTSAFFEIIPDSTTQILTALQIPHDDVPEHLKMLHGFSSQFKNHIIKQVVNMCNGLLSHSPSCHEWMGVLPLLHFINLDDLELGQPYDLPKMNEEVKNFLLCGITANSIIQPDDALKMISPYFQYDWLMPRAFVAVCPYDKMLFHIQSKRSEMSAFACWKIGIEVLPTIDLTNPDEVKNLSNLIKTFLLFFREKDTLISKKEHHLCYRGVNTIVRSVASHRRNLFDIFYFSIDLFLTVMNKSVSFVNQTLIKDPIEHLAREVLKWTGHNEDIQNFSENDLLEELKLWEKIYSIEMLESLQKIWKDALDVNLSLRLDKVKVVLKTNLLLSQNGLQSNILDILFNSILKLLRMSGSEEDACEVLTQIKEAGMAQKYKILEVIISSKYKKEEEISFKSILKSYWPSILDIYGSMTFSNECLVQKTCEKAIQIMNTFFSNLHTRAITPHDIDDLTSTDDPRKLIQEFLTLEQFKNYASDSIDVLKREFSSYSLFQNRRNQLLHLSVTFQEFSKSETTDIKDKLHSDYTGVPVCQLWKYEGSRIIFTFCVVEIPESVIVQVYKLTHSSGLSSQVFQNLYTKKSNDYNPEPDTTLLNVVDMFWNPLVDEFKKDLHILQSSLELPLKKVKYLFNRCIDLEKELSKWCDAVTEIEKSPMMVTSWIRDAAQIISDYLDLCKYSSAAEILMELKKTLELKGDFSSVEAAILSQQEVQNNTSITLATVNKTARETVQILGEITDDHNRVECLKTFCLCMNLVNWVRKVTKNVGQLQSFVQIANQTMEDELIKQLLQDLLKFGSAFAPLIYEVDKIGNCEDLINRCKSLWVFLKEHSNLIDITKTCNKRLGSLKQVEESLSDFQKTNVELLHSINTKGIYHITGTPGKIINFHDQAIQLSLRLHNNECKIFTLKDLRELQSKLVLVAVENADSVNKFIDILSKVERIALLLVQLQEAGFVDYTYYHLSCGCSEYDSNKFDAEIFSMEEALSEWKKTVENHRKEYPHLNFYTSQQLIDLQKEFGQLKKNQDSIASQKLKQLLLSVTPHPHQSKISIALKNALSTLTKDTESVMKESVMLTKGTTCQFDVSSLSSEQKDIYDSLITDSEFEPSAVNAAFLELGEDALEDDLYQWCMDNEHKFKDTKESMPATVLEKEDLILESDPEVLELLDEEYSLSVAMEAVKQAKRDIQLAREIASFLATGRTYDIDTKEPEWSAAKYSQVALSVKLTVSKGDYLSLIELGQVLKELAYEEEFASRDFHSFFKRRKINLFAVDSALMWKNLIFLYMANIKQPLPTYEEVLICTETTTVEEVTLLWHRAVNDEGSGRLFCLVNADKLPFNVSEEVLHNLEVITQGADDFNIAVLINSKDQARNHVASRLSPYLVQKQLPLPSDEDIAQYIFSQIERDLKLKNLSSDQEKDLAKALSKAVHIVLSSRPGMGKSLRVRRMSKLIEKASGSRKSNLVVHIPIHGPEVSVHHILQLMEECQQDPTDPYPQLIHFNIAQNMIQHVDWFLFQVLILGGLTDSFGNIWRRSSKQICVVECTLVEPVSDDQLPSDQASTDRVISLLSVFPHTECVSPKEVQKIYDQQETPSNIALMDESVFKEESVQRVYQYLKRKMENKNFHDFEFKKSGKPQGTIQECLKCILQYMSSPDSSISPSWAELRNFVHFLNAQLMDCEFSTYSKLHNAFKDFVVKFAILMSKEFTEPSVDVNYSKVHLSISESKIWDKCSHPYLFFNQDHVTFTFLGLWVDEYGNLLNYQVGTKTQAIIKDNFMSTELRSWLSSNGVEFEEKYSSWNKEDMVFRLIRVLGIEEQKFWRNKKPNTLDLEKIDPDSTYILTIDNLMKMLAIHMKFRCGIPVVMMGETGCGKTRLLRYLCEIQDKAFGVKTLICLKVHGGFSKIRVRSEVESAIKLAKENSKRKCNYTVLFFDEVNTTEALGLIKEIICDRTLYGVPIPEELKFAAACNPYRIHDEATIKSLQAAGLGFYLRDQEKIPKLGNFPLRKLVYRVLPLPLSMYQYVYDFGTVKGNTEEEYIKKIVHNQLSTYELIKKNYYYKDVCNLVTEVLQNCQEYMREQKNECKYVSLRDVVRAMILFKWFHEKLLTVSFLKENLKSTEAFNKGSCDVARALIYSISVCYYARLTNREPFVQKIAQCFKGRYSILGSKVNTNFLKEIERIQEVFLEAMDIPSNIALNAALRENIFMMVVCIENKLPLFIVGKPGSSKSLAKSIVSSSMQGRYSSNELLKNFKQINLCPYQCNQFSTTESLIEVFEEGMKFQKSQDVTKFASVVVLEEIGLAEDAPGLPLKVLHPYLEDGTAGLDPNEMEIKPEERVAFIGISNWALDPAKMNRGIMVTRCVPDSQELIISAKGIANMVKDDMLRSEVSKSFEPLAKMYENICLKQETEDCTEEEECREFFGLRDFYTMIKMLCWKCIERKDPPTPKDYRHVILRNFSGHKSINPLDELPNPASLISLGTNESETIEIIKESLEPLKALSKQLLPKQENRYLLFITENQSALQILQTELLNNDDTPLVCYGSSFPKDTEYTQVCVNINKIKVCMEKGIPVVLLNYEQIYESLYDVLNQSYTELPTGRYVDLGLRSYRIKCRVDPNFRLIIIAERDRVFKQFPTALINRLEKHFVVSETVLTRRQKAIANRLEKWISDFTSNKESVSASDYFIGYQKDTPSAVTLHISKNYNDDEDKIFEDGMNIILQTASMDVMAFLKSSKCLWDENMKEKAFKIYFDQQEHFSLNKLISDVAAKKAGGALIQITTFGPLLTQNYTDKLLQGLDLNVDVLHLSDFDSQIDFSNKLSKIYESTDSDKKLLIVQSDHNDKKSDLIACARHCLMYEKDRSKKHGVTHVLFIIQLPRVTGGTSFASFQGDPWICVHFDQLTCLSNVNMVIKRALSDPLKAFFRMLIDYNSEVPDNFKLYTRIKESIQVSVSKVGHDHHAYDKTISVLHDVLSEEISLETEFTGVLLRRMEYLLEDSSNWAIDAALNRHHLQASYTLVNSVLKSFDAQIQPVLTDIIACINVNNNLELLRTGDICLKNLWLSLFNNSNFLSLNMSSNVPINGRIYSCKFPFSWELISQIEATLDHKSIVNEVNGKKSFDHYVESLKEESFLENIVALPTNISSILYSYYLHDFVRTLILPFKQEQIESVFELLERILQQLVVIFQPAVESSKESFLLLDAIVGIHIAWALIEKEVLWLAELSDGIPEIIDMLKDKELLSPTGQVIFLVKAVECVINQLLPIGKDWNEASVSDMILTFHTNRSVIETVLYLTTHDDISEESLYDLRSNWQKVVSVVLLAEHVITRLGSLPPTIKMTTGMYTFLKRYTNVIKRIKFSDLKMLKQSVSLLQNIIKALPDHQFELKCAVCKSSVTVDDVVYLPCGHMFCKRCFKEFLKRAPCCSICDTPVQRDKDFPLPSSKRNQYQVLIQVQRYCLDFFMELISQCYFSPTAPEKPSDEFVMELLCMITDPEREDCKGLFTLDEDVSSCPIARSVLLQLLLEYKPNDVYMKLQDYQKFIRKKFGEEYITEDQELILLSFKSFEDGLHKKRVKLDTLYDELVFGTECFTEAFNLLYDGESIRKCQETMSLEFMQCVARVRFGMCLAADIFHQYYYLGPEKRDTLPRATRQKLEEFRKIVQDVITKGVLLGPRDFLIKQLARKFGFPYLCGLYHFEWLNLAYEEFDTFTVVTTKKYSSLSLSNNMISKLKVTDEVINLYQGIKLSEPVTGQTKLFNLHQVLKKKSNLPAFYTHYKNSSLLSNIDFIVKDLKIERQLIEIVIHWIAVLEALPDNNVFVPFKSLIKHTSEYKKKYQPINVELTNTNLSSLSACVLGILKSATCIWITSSNNEVNEVGACKELLDVTVMSTSLPLKQLLSYYWSHFEDYIQVLCRVTQHSFDDCILFLHAVIFSTIGVSEVSVNGNENWENVFDETVIKPITKDMESHIDKGRQVVIDAIKDEQHKTFLQMIYESTSVTSTSILPHLWIYRPQITIDHVVLTLEKEKATDDLKVLNKFLHDINLLKAIKYLPDIVQLQKSLYELCHHRIVKSDATDKSLQDFIRASFKGNKLNKLINSFCIAWNIVKKELKGIPSEYISVEMTPQQTLEYFIPIKEGKGVCSIALATYLAKLQNGFIELSWEKIQVKSNCISLQKIHSCQVISFEKELSHVIFSHCKYSLKAGHGADIKYDFTALEKHILDRFVRGKPSIVCDDISFVSYRNEMLVLETIRNAIHQESLSEKDRNIILQEILETRNLQRYIDNLNITMKFLQLSCSDPNKNHNPHFLLKRFLVSLKMKGKFTKSIEERCELCHIISLWCLLNVEQAKQITNGGQDPFPNINKVFKKGLTCKQKDTLKIALGLYDIDQFLEVFYEYIVIYIKGKEESTAGNELVRDYHHVCEKFTLEKVDSFVENFPKEYSLEHVTAIWMYAVEYQQDQQPG